MDLLRTREPADETAIAEIQARADHKGWGGVDPVSTWVAIERRTGLRATIQKRGAFFFAYADGRASGPSSRAAKAFSALATNEG